MLLVAILFSFSCSSHHEPKDDNSYKYMCDNGAEFNATVHQDSDQIIIKMGDNLYILDITPSASGEKYTDGVNTFWSKGDGSMLDLGENNVYKGCKIVE